VLNGVQGRARASYRLYCEWRGGILARAERPSGARPVRVIDLDTHKLRTFRFGCVGKHSGGVLGTATMPCFTLMAGPVRELQRAQSRTV